MAESEQALFHLVAMPAVRDAVLSPRATLLLSEPETIVLWANAAAAQLFGAGAAAELLGDPQWAGPTFQRQLRDAARQIAGEPVVRGFRVSFGGRHEFIQGSLWRTALPDGSQALVFECPDERRIRRRREHELAEDTLAVFAGQAAAILDEYGLPVAYTESFAGVDIAPEKLEAIGANAGFARGVVREDITDEAGAPFSVSLATLREEPGRHLVVIGKRDAVTPDSVADAPDKDATIAAEQPVETETAVAAALAGAAGLAVVTSDAAEPAFAATAEADAADADPEAALEAEAVAPAFEEAPVETDAAAAAEIGQPAADEPFPHHPGAEADEAPAGDWSLAEDADDDRPVEWHAEELPVEAAEAQPDSHEPDPADDALSHAAEPDAAFAAAPGTGTDADSAPEPGPSGQEAVVAAIASEQPEPAAQEAVAVPFEAAASEPDGQTQAAAAVPLARTGSIRSLLERWYRQGSQETAPDPVSQFVDDSNAGEQPGAAEATVDDGWVADENVDSPAAGVFDFAEPASVDEAQAQPEAETADGDADARAAIESGAFRPAWEQASGGYEPAQADLDHTEDEAEPEQVLHAEEETAAQDDPEPAADAVPAADEPDAAIEGWVETESGDELLAAAEHQPDYRDDMTAPGSGDLVATSELAGEMPETHADALREEVPNPEASAGATEAAAGAAVLTGVVSWLAAERGVEAPPAEEPPQELRSEEPPRDAQAAGETGSDETGSDETAPPHAAFASGAPEHLSPASAETLAETGDRDEEPAADLPAMGFEQAQADAASEPAAVAGGFVFASRPDPVRFAWTVDQDHNFRSVSAELGDTLGPNAADVVGRNWADVARVFGFDRNGDIRRLLEKRDTWSGKTVLWPVQGTDLAVPVDLAALPAFSGARQFDGFRGFGIIRTADAVIDPDEIGLALVDGPFEPRDRDGAAALAVPAEAHSAGSEVETTEEDNFARAMRQTEDSEPDGFAPLPANVVELGARKRDRGEELSSREARAFREIGQRLGGEEAAPAAETPVVALAAPEAGAAAEPEPAQAMLPLAAEPVPEAPEEVIAEAGAPVAEDPATPEALLEDLPVPVLVYRTGETLYANPELLSITGHGSLAALIEAGGVDALFAGAGPSVGVDSAIRISRADGSRLEVRPVLRRVPWQGGRALLLAFRSPYQPEPADDRVAVDQARIEELKSILDTATDGIVITSPGGMVESLNGPAQALFGIAQESAAGKPLTDLFAPESHRTISEYMREVAEPGIAGLLNDGREVIGREAKGGLIPMFVTIGRAGDAGKYCAVLRDITHWKKAEEELVTARRAAETASEQKSEFLARVSHEIRTPLNAIIGFSDVMIEERFGPIDNERYRGYLRDINRSGVHVLDLINDLLDISKIEAGKMELTYEAVDLNLLVQETVALLQPQANSERIIIRTSLSRAVPRVVADARSIRQIILNLVSNAIKFTPANGQVIVSTVYEGNGEVVLRVRDTGRGMTEREIEHAMKPFHQINVTDERRGQGTGLGLPLTKALVEANRAYFDLESTPGEGTIAHVHFPTQRVLAD